MGQAFEGIRVLDFTHVLAGPFATAQLAAMGAEVIKIEAPATPDMMRRDGPDGAGNRAGMGSHYQAQAGGKHSLCLDLRADEGQDIARALIGTADVLVVNYTRSVQIKLGLDAASLTRAFPKLIHCSITGYGTNGPKADHPAYDVVIQAYSGIMNANRNGPDAQAVRVGPPLIDYGTGAQAAFAIAAALFQRQATGTGQVIDVAMADAAIVMQSNLATDVLAGSLPPPPHGNHNPTRPGYQPYPTKDGTIMLGAYTLKQHRALLRALGCSGALALLEGADEFSFLDKAALYRADIAEALAGRTAAHWEAVLNAAHVPAARVRTLSEAMSEPQYQGRASAGAVEGSLGDHQLANLPLAAFTLAQGGPTRGGPAPVLGANSNKILRELGYTAARIEALKTAGVV